MAAVRFGTIRSELRPGESALDGLLREGALLAYACKAGTCGSCMVRAVSGPVPPRSQAGLKDSWKERGYFLPCVCHPEEDLVAEAAGSDARIAAEIHSLDPLSDDVLRVRLACETPLDFRAGQYLTLLLDGGLARSYSIASLPDEGEIELHVRRVPGGRMSGWLFDEARPGDRMQVQGPAGECFYVSGREQSPMVLIGTGTGLAPLYGIVRDALRAGHSGPICLIHGAVRPSGLYLRDELSVLGKCHTNFRYTASVLEGGVEDCVTGPIDGLIATRFPNLEGWRGYVCGDPQLVKSLRMKLFLAGVAMRDLYSDSFLPSAA